MDKTNFRDEIFNILLSKRKPLGNFKEQLLNIQLDPELKTLCIFSNEKFVNLIHNHVCVYAQKQGTIQNMGDIKVASYNGKNYYFKNNTNFEYEYGILNYDLEKNQMVSEKLFSFIASDDNHYPFLKSDGTIEYNRIDNYFDGCLQKFTYSLPQIQFQDKLYFFMTYGTNMNFILKTSPDFIREAILGPFYIEQDNEKCISFAIDVNGIITLLLFVKNEFKLVQFVDDVHVLFKSSIKF